jgi:hypothetical protein
VKIDFSFQRLNVIITRAKVLMIIIGNPKTLQHDRYWFDLLKFCQDNGGCTEKFQLARRPQQNIIVLIFTRTGVYSSVTFFNLFCKKLFLNKRHFISKIWPFSKKNSKRNQQKSSLSCWEVISLSREFYTCTFGRFPNCSQPPLLVTHSMKSNQFRSLRNVSGSPITISKAWARMMRRYRV